MSDVVYDPKDWRSRAGRIVLDLFDPDGNVVATPLDRRWLWRLESFLAVCGTTEEHRVVGRDLRAYLVETCEHHWLEYEADTEDRKSVV